VSDRYWREAVVEVWILDLASSRWLDLVQASSGWTGPTSTVVPPRVIRRRTPYAEMVASAALVEFDRSDLCKGTRSCLIMYEDH